MKILGLKASNFKALTAIEIRPAGKSVALSGDNGAGKSSVIEAIWSALSRHADCRAIHHGEHQAEIELDLGDLIVHRVIRPDGDEELVVVSPDGEIMERPQKLLDRLVARYAVDPARWLQEPPRVQAAQLSRIVGLDLTDVDASREAANADIMAARAEVAAASKLADEAEAPAANVPESADDLDHEAAAAREILRAAIEQQGHATVMQQKHDMAVREIQSLRERLAVAERIAAETEEVLARYALRNLVLEVADATARQAAVADRRRQYEIGQRWRAAHERLEDARVSLAQAVGRHQAALDERDRRLAAVTYPVQGLSVADGEVLYCGRPLTDASQAEQIRIATAIAMAGDPELRVIFCRDASLLGSAAHQALREMADRDGYQLWLEIVDETGERGLRIIGDGAAYHMDGGRVVQAHE